MNNRSDLRTSFIEGQTQPTVAIIAMPAADSGKAVCTLNFKGNSVSDSDDFVLVKNQTLEPEASEGQRPGRDGAIFLKDQYFYIYCQNRFLTLGYFARVFKGVLEIQPK